MHLNEPPLVGINEYLYNNLHRDGINWDTLNIAENDGKPNQLYEFLASSGFNERNKKALDILRNILDIQHKKPFYKVLEYVLNIEKGTQIYIPHIRDHISHSVYVYLLGKLFFRKLPRLEYDMNFEFKWKLTSLLHDLGNPLHLFTYSLLNYIRIIEEVGEILSPIHTSLIFNNIADLTPRRDKLSNSFLIIQERLNSWGIITNIKREYDKNLCDGIIEHGIFSALLMLKIIDGLYTKHNPNHYETDDELERHYGRNRIGWGRNHFDQEIISAAAAISIHNIISNINGHIDYRETPLPFLLILCDTIQEWDRYSPGQRVYDPYSVNLNFINNLPSLIFKLPEYKINKIRNVLGKLRISGRAIEIF